MSDSETQVGGLRRRPASAAGRWGLRLFSLVALSIGALAVAVSCQQKSSDPVATVLSGGNNTGQARMASLGIPTSGPATQPAGKDPNGRPIAKWTRDLGFSYAAAPPDAQGDDVIRPLNATCVACHTPYTPGAADSDPSLTAGIHDTDTLHSKNVGISCVDCHGGNTRVVGMPAHPQRSDANYNNWKLAAHVRPARPELWKPDSAANPELLAAATNTESADYIRFVNPGDLRAATAACAACHKDEVHNVHGSMMAHGAMLWSAAMYNNGGVNRKRPLYGEIYGPSADNPAFAAPGVLVSDPLPTVRQSDRYGMLPALFPLPRWEITQPGNVLRVFERGGKFRPEIGKPIPFEDAGKPDVKLSDRGYGTDLRTDPVFIGLQKTRLFDPTLTMFGTNDHPGDYRASGCSACHVVYANDRSPVHAAYWGRFGNRGQSYSADPTVNPPARGTTRPATTAPSDPWANVSDRERGHPVKHVMVKNMPTSSCIVCHIHPGTNVLNSYLGLMWWDNETDGKLMYPKDQKYPDGHTEFLASEKNPEASATRGLWSDLYPNSPDETGRLAGKDFLEKLGGPEFNSRMTRMQFADFHGHGWVFRGVFKQDRHGNMLDYAGKPVDMSDPAQLTAKMRQAMFFQSPEPGAHGPAGNPVHLKDIHLERGMQCVDCHFREDNHGTGMLYGETRNAVSVDCVDCHGTIEQPSAIFRYLSLPGGQRNGAKGQDLLASALSGNATRGYDRATLIARNQQIINDHFQVKSGRLFQKSSMAEGAQAAGVELTDAEKTGIPDAGGWNVVQTVDTNSADYAPAGGEEAGRKGLARYAHTVRLLDPKKADTPQWGGDVAKAGTGTEADGLALAHGSKTMSCYACHSSWNTSCFGCHIPQRANQRKAMLHNEGIITRNYTNYNYQTLRDDVYMLGVDSTARDHKIAPVRSACAVLVSSQDANRQWIYAQQQTISAEGYSGQSFSPYYPHTVRSTETKTCADCHIHKDQDGRVDNNAITAQLLMQGTNAFNFIGHFAWVGEEDEGLEAVTVTERTEPQAVIGSTLHQIAYPDYYRDHVANNRKLTTAHEHTGTVLDLQLRGEYLYAACGPDGFIAYDVANVDNKGFSERISLAPVSPLGQRFYVRSKYATSICSPSTLALDPTRKPLVETQKLSDGTTRTFMPNDEGKITEVGNPDKVLEEHRGIHPLYAYLYLTDREEGLIVIGNPGDSPNKPGVSTLLDGDPTNNFLERAVTFNPNGLLKGARHMALHGVHAYISTDHGLVVVDLNDPLHPRVVQSQVPGINGPRRVQFQFRYAYVCDKDGVKVLDVTDPARPQLVADKSGNPVVVPLHDARDIYLVRTWGFVAAGKDGVVVLDIERPEAPRRLGTDELGGDFNAQYKINDAHAVRYGMTNASMFLYVADGHNGLKVLQLTSPEYTPTYLGFAPRITPKLVSWYPTHGPAVALSEGLDRDRAVDEAGNQLSVFGRRGARPMTLEEQQRLYMKPTTEGPRHEIFTISETPDPAGKLAEPQPASKPAEQQPTEGQPRPPVGPRRPPLRPR